MRKVDEVLDRIATATSVRRTRSEDAARHTVNGGHRSDLANRQEAAAKALDKAARAIEAMIE